MFDTYLQEGDIVYLKSGMTVGVQGVRSVITDETISPFCPFISTTSVKIGKEYQSRTDVSTERSRIKEVIKQAFADEFVSLDESILDRFLAHQVRNPEKMTLYIHPTRYMVTEVRIQGKKRTVYCKEHFNENGHSVYFYQGGDVSGPLVHNYVQRV